MLTNTELERRDHLASLEVNSMLFRAGQTQRNDKAERQARRLRRQRREDMSADRRLGGWSVRLW